MCGDPGISSSSQILSPWIGLNLYSLITQLLLSSLPDVEDLRRLRLRWLLPLQHLSREPREWRRRFSSHLKNFLLSQCIGTREEKPGITIECIINFITSMLGGPLWRPWIIIFFPGSSENQIKYIYTVFDLEM